VSKIAWLTLTLFDKLSAMMKCAKLGSERAGTQGLVASFISRLARDYYCWLKWRAEEAVAGRCVLRRGPCCSPQSATKSNSTAKMSEVNAVTIGVVTAFSIILVLFTWVLFYYERWLLLRFWVRFVRCIPGCRRCYEGIDEELGVVAHVCPVTCKIDFSQAPLFQLSSRRTTHPANEGIACAICLEEYQAGSIVRELRCQHCFHRACIDPWLMVAATIDGSPCPICRALVPVLIFNHSALP